MEFGKLIDTLGTGEAQEKTASAPEEETGTEQALEAALEKVAAQAPAPAASGDPVEDLMKVASDLAGVEKEAEIQHAALLGQAFADAALGTWSAYDADLRKQASETAAGVNEQVKSAALEGYYQTVAALQNQEQPATEKVATNEEIEALVKQAEAQGYTREQTLQAIQELSTKTAAEQFEMGQDLAMNEAYATAYGEFMKGASVTYNILESMK
jgi:hypothetical protein